MTADLSGRHPEVVRLHGYFTYSHLSPLLQGVSEHFADLADTLVRVLPDSPELTACLRKLLESKDCAVRTALLLAADDE